MTWPDQIKIKWLVFIVDICHHGWLSYITKQLLVKTFADIYMQMLSFIPQICYVSWSAAYMHIDFYVQEWTGGNKYPFFLDLHALVAVQRCILFLGSQPLKSLVYLSQEFSSPHSSNTYKSAEPFAVWRFSVTS